GKVPALTGASMLQLSADLWAHTSRWSLPTLIVCLTTQKRVNYINEYTVERLSVNKKSIAGRPFEEVLPAGNNQHKISLQRAIEFALEGKETINVESSLRAGGTVIDTLLSVRPIINNYEVQGVILSMRDVTEIRKSHEQIARSETQLREAQQLAKIGSWEWDTVANEIKWSDELYRIFGLERDSFDVTYENYLDALHPDDRTRVNELIQEAYKTKESFTFFHRVRNNPAALVFSKGHVVTNAEGLPIKMFGTGQDVAEMKKNEQKLEEQNEQLKKINSELDRFVYSVSHDLRSPLTSMQGLISLARGETQDTAMLEYLDMLESSSVKLDKFIMDILDYSRNSRMETQTQPVNLHGLVSDVLSHFRSQAQSRVRVETENIGDPIIQSDRTRLTMILNNLVSNAVRYSDARSETPFVKVLTETNVSGFSITVIDNGIGIPVELQDRVFEMFFRGTKDSIGSGLGLYIVKEAVEKLHGTISLDSSPGKGTVFHINIPNVKVPIPVNKAEAAI
ncbi:MAG: PAS domain S-box protein, partial [Chitinophagaceae bacterium]